MKQLLFILCFLTSLGLSADTQKKRAALTGLWQQVGVDPHDGRQMRLPVWKVLQEDGHFFIFLIANQHAQSIITNRGTYKPATDSTYVEHITGSITNTEMVGRSNTITYRFLDKDRIEVSYNLPEAPGVARETWVRVKLELPK